MAYLIGQLVIPLIAALAGGALAGWSWHCIRHRDRWAARDGERDRLRGELLSLVGVTPPPDPGPLVDEDLAARLREAEEQVLALQRQLAAREDAGLGHESRIAELEMELASARAAAPDPSAETARFTALQETLRAAQDKGADLERRAGELEALLQAQPQPPGVDVAAMRWRLRELEAQLAARSAEDNIARLTPVEAPPPPPTAPDLSDALNREHWRARYLQARVAYLEGQAQPAPLAAVPEAPPPAPVDEEAENRRRWRQRYLEARLAWLEGRLRDAQGIREGLAGDIALRDARITDLEAAAAAPPPEDPRVPPLLQRVAELEGALAAARSETTHAATRVADLEATLAALRNRLVDLESQPAPAAPVADPEAASLRWRSRYLDSRVRFLEQSLAGAQRAAPAVPPAPRDDSFAPLAPAGAEVRPLGLPAPRDGARDDLRLIEGVDPRTESTLNSLGIYHFDQIAAWTPQNVDWIERYLAFKGRIGREDWVRQAQALVRQLQGAPV